MSRYQCQTQRARLPSFLGSPTLVVRQCPARSVYGEHPHSRAREKGGQIMAKWEMAQGKSTFLPSNWVSVPLFPLNPPQWHPLERDLCWAGMPLGAEPLLLGLAWGREGPRAARARGSCRARLTSRERFQVNHHRGSRYSVWGNTKRFHGHMPLVLTAAFQRGGMCSFAGEGTETTGCPKPHKPERRETRC